MVKFNSRLMKGSMILSFILIIVLGISIFSITTRFEIFDSRITNLEKRLDERTKAEEELTNQLKKISEQNEEIKRIEEERQLREQLHSMAVQQVKENGLSLDDDLGKPLALNANDINKMIDGWIEYRGKDSVLKDHGEAFIIASRETGLNPIYLLAHAFVESGYGTSYYAVTRNNFFGINAVDANPDLASTMGDSVDQGIINGAIWIQNNFYDNGYCSLREMHDAGYATSKNWARDIASVANSSVRFL